MFRYYYDTKLGTSQSTVDLSPQLTAYFKFKFIIPDSCSFGPEDFSEIPYKVVFVFTGMANEEVIEFRCYNRFSMSCPALPASFECYAM